MKHFLIVLALVFTAGCPRHTRRTLTPDVPSSGDAHARSRFLEAKSRFLRDGGSGAEFGKIVSDFPEDPMEQRFAALMLRSAAGDPPYAQPLGVLPATHTTVEDYARQLTSGS